MPSNRFVRILILLLLTVAGSVALAAPAIYKWVDSEGNVHFSDCPPAPEEKCDIEELAVESGPALSEEELQQIAERRAEWMQELHERSEAKQQQRREERAARRVARAQEAAFGAQQCHLARENLEQLLLEAPVYRYRLDRPRKAEHQREIETLKDIETMIELIDQYCED